MTRPETVVTIGRDDPPAFLLIPADLSDLCLEHRVAIEVELHPDPLGMLEDLGCVGVLLFRDVAGLLEQRQVDIRFHIALRSRIAVPVPGPTEVAAFLDNSEIVYSRLFQTGGCQQTTETAADYQHPDLVIQTFPGKPRLNIGIVDITAEVAV